MSIYTDAVQRHPALKQGRVKCDTCGREQYVDSARALREGWPECCGYTMTLQTQKRA